MNAQDQSSNNSHQRSNGRIFGGLYFLFVGALFILREMSFPFFPNWFFTWPMILIAIGIYIGIQNRFRKGGWIVLILLGDFFLFDEMNLGINFHRFTATIVIISIGLFMILQPRRYQDWYRFVWEKRIQKKGHDKFGQRESVGTSSKNRSSED